MQNTNVSPTAHNVGILAAKLADEDSDFRYMALNDLCEILKVASPTFLLHDVSTCARAVEGLLKTLNDSHGEVQNMAVKCLGHFVTKLPDTILTPLIGKIAQLQLQNPTDASVPALALRTVVMALPKPEPGVPRTKAVMDAYSTISKALIPRLVGYAPAPHGHRDASNPPRSMLTQDIESGIDTNTIDVIIDIARIYGPMLQEHEVSALQKTVFEVFQSDRSGSVLRKKAVVAISVLSPLFTESLLSRVVSIIIEHLRNSHLTHSRRKLYFLALGSLAKATPKKFGPHLSTLAPFVLSAVSEQELKDRMAFVAEEGHSDPEADDVLEAALVTLESFLSSCSAQMHAYADECIDAATRLLRYDPNVAVTHGDDMAADDDDVEEGLDQDEDFEMEQEFDDDGEGENVEDDDDISWKTRRYAAKVFHTIIQTRSNGDLLEDGTLYDRVAPALIASFKEREEGVRLEVLAALSCLVQKTAEYPGVHQPPSRKRRRGGSDASMRDSQTNVSLAAGYAQPDTSRSSGSTDAHAMLTKRSPEIVGGLSQLLGSSPLPTKQSSIILLNDIVTTQCGGLSDYLDQLIKPILAAINTTGDHTSSSGPTPSSATFNSLRIHALQLVASILELQPPQSITPYLGEIVPVVVRAVQDKISMVANTAVKAAEQAIKLLACSQSATTGGQVPVLLEKLYSVLMLRISDNAGDLEVRNKLIRLLGLLLAHTSGVEELLPKGKRTAALNLLAERLRNELTRLAAAKAIEDVVAHGNDKSEFEKGWVRGVCLELSAQLRKADRTVRSVSLHTLKSIALEPAIRQKLDSDIVQQVVRSLIPVLDSDELNLLGMAFAILDGFVNDHPNIVMSTDMIKALRSVVHSTIVGSALDALLSLMQSIGEKRVGAGLMKILPKDVDVAGNPDVLGKVVGTLLASGGRSTGVGFDEFITELRNTKDNKRICLALAVLSEASLRLGHRAPVQPELFLETNSKSGSLAGAVAFGRAAAGNVKTYLPFALKKFQTSPALHYTLLHSIKELLQHSEAHSEILPYAQALWDALMGASEAEDNKAIAAECVGRLAIIDPKTCMPQLQVS